MIGEHDLGIAADRVIFDLEHRQLRRHRRERGGHGLQRGRHGLGGHRRTGDDEAGDRVAVADGVRERDGAPEAVTDEERRPPGVLLAHARDEQAEVMEQAVEAVDQRARTV